MKKFRTGFIILFLVLIVCGYAFSETITVKQKMTKVRTQPKFYAPEVAVVNRGDWLEEISKSGPWIQVKTLSGAEGWIHSSACVLKKITLSKVESMGAGNVSADEAALAGKGFNPIVEKKYRESHPGLNYRLLDEIESLKIDDNDLIAFLKEGRLGEFGGDK